MQGAALCTVADVVLAGAQRFFGTAVGKGRQAAKTEIERLKLREIACEQGINEVAKMCACRSCCTLMRSWAYRGCYTLMALNFCRFL